MATKINTKVMLPVLAVLLLIKFALMPVVAWQNDLLGEIEQHEQRNTKAQRLLDSEGELVMQLAQLSKEYDNSVAQYPRFPSAADFRIETQIAFDLMVQIHQLESTQFFWRSEVDSEIFPGMWAGRFNIRMVGKMKDFILLQTQLSTTEQAFRVVNFSATMKNVSPTSAGEVKGVMTIEAFYWLGEQ